jgi:hypothetical protein
MQVLNNDGFNNNNEDKTCYNNFYYSYKVEVTRKNSLSILKYYMNFLGIKNISELVRNKPQKIIESDIKAYLVYLRNEKKISYGAAALYLSVIKKFYIVNTEFPFRWKIINMYLGNDDTDEDDQNSNNQDLTDGEEEQQQDRPYSTEEIKQMFNAAQDIRVKIVISLLSSSGLRHGALNIIKLRDLEKIEKYNIYKITAYRKSKKYKYYTYCTPECTNLIDTYLEYRKNKGEELKGNSPLIREQFSTNDKLKINNPRHLTSRSIRTMINDVLIKYTNLRKKLTFDYKNNRKVGKNPTMLTHGFRKFFTVECTKAGVYHEIVERLVGHTIPGSRNSYLIFNPQTLLEGTADCKGYVTAIDALTINDENRLKKENQELKQQDDYNKFVIEKQLKEIREQNKILNQKVSKYDEYIKYRQVCEQKIYEITDAGIEERHLKEEYESITDDQKQKRKKDSVYKNLLEIRKKKIRLENEYSNLLSEHITKKHESNDDNDQYF